MLSTSHQPYHDQTHPSTTRLLHISNVESDSKLTARRAMQANACHGGVAATQPTGMHCATTTPKTHMPRLAAMTALEVSQEESVSWQKSRAPFQAQITRSEHKSSIISARNGHHMPTQPLIVYTVPSRNPPCADQHLLPQSLQTIAEFRD
jgi:hypothetical protein